MPSPHGRKLAQPEDYRIIIHEHPRASGPTFAWDTLFQKDTLFHLWPPKQRAGQSVWSSGWVPQQLKGWIPEWSGVNFGHITRPGLRITWESAGPNSRHDSSTENACRFPKLLMKVSTTRSTVFKDGILSSTESSSSKGALRSPARTRSQEGMRCDLGTWWLGLASPRIFQSTASWCAAIVATCTFKV